MINMLRFKNPSGLEPDQKSLTRSKNEPGFAKPPINDFIIPDQNKADISFFVVVCSIRWMTNKRREGA